LWDCSGTATSVTGYGHLQDGFGHFVQLEALVALDGELFVVVLPGGEDEQLTAGDG